MYILAPFFDTKDCIIKMSMKENAAETCPAHRKTMRVWAVSLLLHVLLHSKVHLDLPASKQDCWDV